ncbi:MAG: protein-disulfide reductase DsbD domain-containing protein [Candidatus Aminicenantales bacterium]
MDIIKNVRHYVHSGRCLKRGGILVFASWLFLLHQPISFLKAEPGFFWQSEQSLVRAELIPEFLWVEAGKTFSLWLKISIEPGWHIYWKNPGEAGLPTTISWELPPGINLVSVSWPWPAKFVDSLAICYGYSEQVLVLAQFSVSSQAAPPSPFRTRAEIVTSFAAKGAFPGHALLRSALRLKKRPHLKTKNSSLFFLQDARS